MAVDNNGIFNSQSLKYKAILVVKPKNAVNNTNNYVKNKMFVRLCIFQRQLQTNYSWFK